MKRISRSIMALAMVAGFLLTTPVAVLQAADATATRPYPGGAAGLEQWQGSFDGYDAKAGMVWVGDRVFEVSSDLRVIGTTKKAGMLSGIGQGETVTIIYGDSGSTGIPVAVEIRRR